MSPTRLCAFLCICTFTHGYAAEARNCPVTKAADAFVPPSPYINTTASGSFLFGTPKLWTLVHPNSWTGRKLVWWSPGSDRDTSIPPNLTVTLKRLDASAPLLTTGQANWGTINGQPPFITTGLPSPPTTGCWEITGHMEGAAVKYIVRL